MPRHSIGDRVVCQIRDHSIVSMYDTEYDQKSVFEIIAFCEEGYLVYVPHDMLLRGTTKIRRDNYKQLRVSKKFIDDEVCYISDYKILSVHSVADGMICARCEEFVSMSGPNQPDKVTFICYLCKENKFR
jgi:hypothetical protein